MRRFLGAQARFQDALAFTRSLGDLHLHVYGVSFDPEVVEYDLAQIYADAGLVGDKAKDKTSALFVCTDGVWDNWRYDDITKHV